MGRKVASRILLTALILGMLTLAFNIQPAKAQTYYYNFKIMVTPEFPTTLDEIKITISFDKTASFPVTFSDVGQIGNEFFVDIDIYIPELWFPMIMHQEYTYTLERLPAGSYTFTATVTISGWGFGYAQYSESFIVSPPAVPEFPIGFVFEIAFTPVLMYLWWRRKHRTLRITNTN